jgi:inhibitor of KinA sporulation pathway (predicted exonuclease)
VNNAPRLKVELVPELAWGRNVRAVVGAGTWEALRWYLGAARWQPGSLSVRFPDRPYRAKLLCAYCKAEQETLDLHEEWHYDEAKRTQRLTSLKPICSECHLSKHLGYAQTIGRGEDALTHLARVNGWSKRQAQQHSDFAFSLWRSRSGTAYNLDVSALGRYHIPPTRIHMAWLENPGNWGGSRLDAIVWAKRMLDSEAIVLDTETTGLLSRRNVEVIELAAVNMKGRVVFQSLFKPRYKIPAHATKIHGITDKHVKVSPTFAEQAEALFSALDGKTIVTYNAWFDRKVLERTVALHKVADISARWECAMRAFRTFSGSGRFLPLGGSHRALADCRATLKLIRRMARAKWSLP